VIKLERLRSEKCSGGSSENTISVAFLDRILCSIRAIVVHVKKRNSDAFTIVWRVFYDCFRASKMPFTRNYRTKFAEAHLFSRNVENNEPTPFDVCPRVFRSSRVGLFSVFAPYLYAHKREIEKNHSTVRLVSQLWVFDGEFVAVYLS